MPASTHPAAMFSSATDDWATPVAFYDRLDAEFGFALDVCASTTNRKSATFYALDHPDAERRDGLARDWVADAAAAAAGAVSGAGVGVGVGAAVWMNPPYGNPIADWMGKAHQAAHDGATVVCLVPVRSDTAWWQDLVLSTGAEVRYVRGRLKFGQATTAAPFASAVVIYRPTDIPGAPGPVGVMPANAPVTAPAGPSRSAGPAGTDPADEVAAYVATFTPRRLDEAAWALAAPVVRVLVTAANPHSVAAARLYLSHLVGLLSDPDVWDRTSTPAITDLLARPVVNAHLARSTFKSPRTKATHRDTLYRLGRSTWQLKHPSPRVARDRADTFLLAGAGLDVSVAALMRARANLPRAPRDGLKEVVRHLQLDRTDLHRLGNVAAADDSTVWTWASLRKLTEAANQELTVPSTAAPTQTAATPGAPAKPTSRRARIAAAKADHDNRQAAEAARAARLDAGPAGLLVLPTTADLAEPIRVVVERFEPQKKARNAWAANRDLAMALVTAYNPSSPRTAQTTCSYVALLLTWLEQRPGHPVGAPVSVGELLEEGLPEKWIDDLHWSDPSKASARSVLRRIVRTLNPDGAAVRLEHHGVTAPYSPQMCDWFALAAWHQPTQATTRDLCFVVGLGLGAGLDARDLRHLTRLSFTEATHAGKDVLFVAVTGDGARERVVPVRDAYVALVRRGLELHEATGKAATDLVLGKVRDRNNVVGPVVNRTRTATTENVEVRMSALRNTWLVAQLCSPISLADLLPVAGLASGRTIAGLLPYCPAPDAVETDAVLAALTGPSTRSTRSVQSGLPVQTEAAAR